MGGSAPKTPTYALSHIKASGIGSWCPPLFAPHYVAWKASRCRRFIGDTQGSRVFVSAVGTCLRSDCGSIRGGRRTQCASYKVQSKVCEVESFEFLFLRFRDLRNFNFADFAFFVSSIR